MLASWIVGFIATVIGVPFPHRLLAWAPKSEHHLRDAPHLDFL